VHKKLIFLSVIIMKKHIKPRETEMIKSIMIMQKKLLAGLAVVMLCVGLSSIQAFAATLIVEGGLLTGAQGVLVGDDVYDVKFVTGTPQGIFYTPDGWDFVFNDGQAISASQALLDQVFINYPGVGMFDDNPSSIVGGDFYRVDIITPTRDWNSDWVYVVAAVNFNDPYYGGGI
jgi:hypothetical protein